MWTVLAVVAFQTFRMLNLLARHTSLLAVFDCCVVLLWLGFFNPYSAHGSYYPCPTGTFASAPGSSACTACPAGKFSAAQLGATACSSNCTLSMLPGAASCAPGGCSYCDAA